MCGATPAPRRCAQPPKKPADPAPKKPADPAPKDTLPSNLEATIGLKDVEVGELLTKLDVKLGYKIAGKVSADLTLTVPVGSAASSSAYEFIGTVSSPALTLEGLTLRDVSATATYKNGKLTLRELKATVPQLDKQRGRDGTLRGTAAAAVDPPGDVTAALTLDQIPLGEVLKALPGFAMEVKGTVSGKAEVKGLYAKISDPAAWTGSAQLTAPELVVAGRTAKDAKLLLSLANGAATLKDLSAKLEGIPVTATATMELTGKYPFTANLKTAGTSVADLRKLVPEAELAAPVEGVLDTDTRVTGTVTPLAFTATGTVNATKLTLAKSEANTLELKWEVTAERLLVKSLKADLFGGSLAGTADVPFATDKAGAFDLKFKEVDVAAAMPLVPDLPVRIGGKVSGFVKGTIAPAKGNPSRVGNIDLELTAPKMTLQNLPVQQVVGKADVKGGAIEYSLTGKLLSTGSFVVKGRYPGATKKPAAPPPAPARAGWGNGDELTDAGHDVRLIMRKQPADDRGSFRLTGADLSRVAPDFGIASLAPLRGRLDITFDYANDFSSGEGRIVLSGLKWGETSIARDISAAIVLRDGVLQLADVNGGLGGGTLRGRARVFLNNTARNYFTLAIDGADAKRLFAIVPDLASRVDGRLTIVIRGQVGRDVRASGTVTLERGTVSGVAVSGLRIPFNVAATPGGYGRLTIREAKVNAGSGTALAELTMNWGTAVRVDGQVKLVNVPIRTISPDLGDFGLLGNGRLTGRFDLAGTNVRSIDDLNGSLVAMLGNTSPREVPILQQAVPFLNPAGLVKPFDTGDIRANLTRGVFRIQRLALVSPNAQLFAEGNISLAGRVDMNVVAHTGTIGPSSRGLRLFGLRVPAFGPVPIGLIRDVSDFLSNRTVRLSITGTVSDPKVQVNVAALITEQAVRFFVSRYVPGNVAEIAGLAGVGGALGAAAGDSKK